MDSITTIYRETYQGHKRHVLCRCPPLITFSYESLPKEIWVAIFEYLEFFDLINVKMVNKFFRDCLKVYSIQEELFTAPLDERAEKKYKEGNQVQLHPALANFGCTILRDIENYRRGQRHPKVYHYFQFYVGRSYLYGLPTEFLDQNLTNPPLKLVKLYNADWTKESMRDFILHSDLFRKFVFTENGFKRIRYERILKRATQESGESLPSEAISVGDMMKFMAASQRKVNEADDIDWDRLEIFDNQSWQWEKEHDEENHDYRMDEALDFGEDEGHGTPLNWEDHFKRLKRDEWLVTRDKFIKENPTNSARLVSDARFEAPYKLKSNQKGEFYINLFQSGFTSEPMVEVETRWGELLRARLSLVVRFKEMSSII